MTDCPPLFGDCQRSRRWIKKMKNRSPFLFVVRVPPTVPLRVLLSNKYLGYNCRIFYQYYYIIFREIQQQPAEEIGYYYCSC